MKGKKVYLIIESSWNGNGGYSFEDAYVYESEEVRNAAYECVISAQKRVKDYDTEWSKYETEIL